MHNIENNKERIDKGSNEKILKVVSSKKTFEDSDQDSIGKDLEYEI